VRHGAVSAAAVRRSQGLLLTGRVVVSGTQVSGLPFSEEALMQVVNAHGALILMKQMVSIDDHLRLRRLKTGQEIACIVVGVGVAFDEPTSRFWHVAFPPGDRPAKSPEAKKLSPPAPRGKGAFRVSLPP
jgi:hypothetical protein